MSKNEFTIHIKELTMNSIICGNNAEVMAGWPDGFIDLTVASPPYDNLRDYNGYDWDFEPLARQLFRCTKQGGVVVWVVADATVNGSETGSSFRQALGFMDCGFNLHDTMIYEFLGTGAKGSNYSYWQAFEYMFVFSKGKPSAINLIEDRVNKRHGAKGSPRWGKSGSYTIKKISRRTNIWRYGGNMAGTGHPAPFPEALARDHIISWSNAGDLVFDPFLGSGTTAKMAIETGRNYLGIDISEEYCRLARQRVAGANRPLFAP